jgi:hypothetical protein
MKYQSRRLCESRQKCGAYVFACCLFSLVYTPQCKEVLFRLRFWCAVPSRIGLARLSALLHVVM